MQRLRREFLATGASIAALGITGCQTSNSDDSEGGGAQTTVSDGEGSGTKPAAGPKSVAVAAEWNAIRARVRDALALGLAEEFDAGASIAHSTFERFETAGGEYGAHEMLEHTSEEHYEGFEEALGELRTEGLKTGDEERIREEADLASTHLADAQQSIVDESAAHALDLQLLGASVLDAAALAAAGNFDGAHATAKAALAHFEDASVHDAIEDADHETYEAFESSVKAVVSAADSESSEPVQTEAANGYSAAIDGSYELASSESAAGAGHIATLQARGWDAVALSSLGGPSADYAHAAALTLYRARAADCQWLAVQGEHEEAATMANDVFAHFEGARAHEALEGADHEAYEGFEDKLDAFGTALSEGGDVESAADSFARAALYAQFAIVGSTDDAPVELPLDGSSGGGDEDSEGDADLKGGPNVVEGVPDDADHVVDMEAVAFAPRELTISKGDTVAWKHVGGEPHSVTASEDSIPEDAAYWASGDFDSESVATDGWEDGTGAVQSGQSYVYTFETAGTHEYYCIPHEKAGMTGSITVE